MNNIALQLIAIGQFCKWRLLKPCFRQLVSCTSCVKAFCSFFHGGRQESGAGNNESSVCSSSPMVYSPLEGPHHGCIEQISLRGSVDSSYDISGGKNGDRKSLLLERKQSDEVESRFFQKRDFPLPGSEQHEKIRNKLRKYIQETFLGNEGVSSNEIDEKGGFNVWLTSDCLLLLIL